MSENIIYHDFGGSKNEAPKPESSDLEEKETITNLEEEKAKHEQRVLALANLLGGRQLGEKLERFTSTLSKLRSMREYITSLQVMENAETMGIRNDLIEGMSFEQMCNAILDSDEMKWQNHPSYYIALSRRFTTEHFDKLIEDALK